MQKIWKELTLPTLDRDGQEDPPKVAREPELAEGVLELLERSAERVTELG